MKKIIMVIGVLMLLACSNEKKSETSVEKPPEKSSALVDSSENGLGYDQPTVYKGKPELPKSLRGALRKAKKECPHNDTLCIRNKIHEYSINGMPRE